MANPTARVIQYPGGQYYYELTLTRGPFETQIQAGHAARAEIVAASEAPSDTTAAVLDDLVHEYIALALATKQPPSYRTNPALMAAAALVMRLSGGG